MLYKEDLDPKERFRPAIVAENFVYVDSPLRSPTNAEQHAQQPELNDARHTSLNL